MQESTYAAKLFYSYSHKDSQHRESMENALALLKSDGLLNDWSDQSILPGHRISEAIRANMDDADIIVFLLSQDFIASEECMKEWRHAEQLASNGRLLFRIPIVVRDCAWQDLLASDDLKALPKDGFPVVSFPDQHTAWQQVYEGIKSVIDMLKSTFTVKADFLADMERTDFISQGHLNLTDLFVFLPLMSRGSLMIETEAAADIITEPSGLLDKKYTLIYGPERSGKSALGRFIVLTLAKQGKPVLHVDLNQIPQNAGVRFFRQTYSSQFNGDYSIWEQKADKTLVLDNLAGRSDMIDFVVASKEIFDRVIVTLSSDIFYSFFRDESRLADFEEMEIGTLTHVAQEALIRKRLALKDGTSQPTDGYVDQIEGRINSIIIDDRIVPRYPFFVLCILQTYEAFMPTGVAITSYGHCYYALIIASLMRAGISQEDSDINVCLNFAEHLAFKVYRHRENNEEKAFDFQRFVQDYRRTFVIPDAIVCRLRDDDFGLILSNGEFRTPYMHYYFLGRFLSKGDSKSAKIVGKMCDATYLTSNYLTLLFTVHHTREDGIIDDILLRTICTLDEVPAAKLQPEETRRFQALVSGLQRNVLSAESVESERHLVRSARDEARGHKNGSHEPRDDTTGAAKSLDVQEAVNDCYRVLKNNEIMGQILRNKYGSMTISKIEEVIEIMADGGLRLVNIFLKDEQEIVEMAQYIKTKNPNHDIERIRRDLQRFSFLWTMVNVERIVGSINVPEIRPSIVRVAEQAATPAFDVIAYFTLLEAAEELTEQIRKELDRLLIKHKDPFVRGILSIRTQAYINTHRGEREIEQRICSLLGVKYLPRPGRLQRRRN